MPHSNNPTDVAALFLPRVKSKYAASRLAAIIILALTDIASISTAMVLAYIIRVRILSPISQALFIPYMPPSLKYRLSWVLVIGFLCLAYEGLYKRRLPFWRETRQVIKAITLAFLLMFAVLFLGKISDEVSRTVLMLGYLASVVLVPLGRLISRKFLVWTNLGLQPVLILGVGKTGELVARSLIRDQLSSYRIVGFLDDDPAKREHEVRINGARFPVLGGFREVNKVMKKTGVRHLIVAAPGMPAKDMVRLVNRLQRQSASITIIPDLFGIPVMGAEVDYSFDEQILSFRIRNRLANPWNMAAKRLFDLLISSATSVVVLPLMVIIALAIRLDSPGPVFFSHRRVGRAGKEFSCHKFRTMVANAQESLEEILRCNPEFREEWEQNFKLKEDPRITRVGRFLRKTSLDELPQLFNVLKGDMSLVGPRPIIQKEVAHFENSASYYFMVRPGIAGLWQVSGRNDINYPERVRLESWYVRNWSLWLDITLLIRTVGAVLTKRGAY